MYKPLIILTVIIGVAAFANQPVTADQGRPGNQGPWPVTGTIVIYYDGGANILGSTFPAPCSQLVSINDAGISTSATRVPPNGGTNGRIWIRVCNSLLNASNTLCICGAEACPNSVAVGQIGDVLATGDCVTYNETYRDGGVPCCVCNGAGSFLPTVECVP